jgi:ADP-ribose pyrophosphatase YjhB (NUDIX family)
VGGRWEFGETLAEAVTREVQEETGLTTTFVALRSVVNELLAPGDPSAFGAHFVIFVCEVEALSGEPSEQAEGQVAWFTVSQLSDLHRHQAIVSTDYRILEQSFTLSRSLSYVETEVRLQGSSESSTVRFENVG